MGLLSKGQAMISAVARRASTRDGDVEESADKDHALHLSTLAGLGARSFWAYGVPVPDSARTEWISICKKKQTDLRAVTHFVDTDFATHFLDKTVSVTVKCGRVYFSTDATTGYSTPYAKVAIGPSCGFTRFKRKTLEPEWNETLTVFTRRHDAAAPLPLKVEMWDNDFGRADDFIGEARVTVPLEGEVEFEEVLYHEGRATCQVTFVVKVTPMTEAGFRPGRKLPQVHGPEDSIEAANFEGHVLRANNWKLFPAWRSFLGVLEDTPLSFARHRTVALVASHESDTQAFVSWNPDDKSIVLSFRGTEAMAPGFKDIITDINYRPVHLHPHETDADLASEGATLPLPALGGATASLQAMVSGDNKPDLDHQGSTQGGADENLHQHTAECETEEPGPLPDDGVVPKVHQGFNAAVHTVLPTIKGLVDMATGGDKSWRIYVTGHSLGAALATIAAYRLATRCDGPKYPVHSYTFAAPRCGNEVFAMEFNKVVRNNFRVYRHDDIVTQVPRSLCYTHVARAVELRPKEQVMAVRAHTKVEAGDLPGTSEDSIRVACTVLEPLKPNGLRKTLQTNMHILEILASPEGFAAGHTTPSYLATLIAIMGKASHSPAVEHAVAAVTAALQQYKAEAEAEAAQAKAESDAKGCLLTRAWGHVAGGGEKHHGGGK